MTAWTPPAEKRSWMWWFPPGLMLQIWGVFLLASSKWSRSTCARTIRGSRRLTTEPRRRERTRRKHEIAGCLYPVRRLYNNDRAFLQRTSLDAKVFDTADPN